MNGEWEHKKWNACNGARTQNGAQDRKVIENGTKTWIRT